ncbi:MAG: hypothetical protein AB7G68_14220 [Nitrospiraceae bacterium]
MTALTASLVGFHAGDQYYPRVIEKKRASCRLLASLKSCGMPDMHCQ